MGDQYTLMGEAARSVEGRPLDFKGGGLQDPVRVDRCILMGVAGRVDR